MANLTIVIDDDTLKRARIKAIQEGTSVNEVCRQAIERFATVPAQGTEQAILTELRTLSSGVRPPESGEPMWPGREALYEDVMRERGLVKDRQPAPRRRKT
jgi:hypothetical protein